MTKFNYSMTTGGLADSLVAFRPDGEQAIYQANGFNPNWEGIVAGLEAGDEGVWELFDVASGIKSRLMSVSERVSFDGDSVLFDGVAVHHTLANQLERVIQSGNADNYTALARFWEKLESNPSEHSRNQAYDWLAAHKFQITPDGDVVGYKGVEDLGNGEFLSGWASRVSGVPSGYRNGVPVPELSQIPQTYGDVITMPRDEVVHNPRMSCERGLHVATWDYAGSYGHRLMVFVNPRDIVSVPTSGGGAKVRVCRYVVAPNENVVEPGESPVLRSEHTTWTPDVSWRDD